MNYYQRHLGDYARDTAHLSVLEHGVYTLLLDRYYATEQPIPADQAYRVARAKSKDEKEAVDAVLGEFFTLVNGNWENKRARGEIERAQVKIEAARANGKSGGRPRANRDYNPRGTKQEPTGLSPGIPAGTQAKALQSPISNLQAPHSESKTPSAPSEEEGSGEPNGTQWVTPRETLSAEFEPFMVETYPKTGHPSNLPNAWHMAQGLVGMGLATEPQLRERLTNFRKFVDGGGYSDRSKIPTAQSWFNGNDPRRYWGHDWEPLPTKAEQQQGANVEAAQQFLKAGGE